jgi:hypothetical protein
MELELIDKNWIKLILYKDSTIVWQCPLCILYNQPECGYYKLFNLNSKNHRCVRYRDINGSITSVHYINIKNKMNQILLRWE